MFKKKAPNVCLSGGSVCGSGYPVTHPVEKNGVTIYSESPISVACPELGSPESFSLEAQQLAGIPIVSVDSAVLPPSGDVNSAFNKLNTVLSKPKKENENE